jgi:hypothetical protein
MIKLIDYKRFFRSFTGMLGRGAECCADAVLPKLRRLKVSDCGSQGRLYEVAQIAQGENGAYQVV